MGVRPALLFLLALGCAAQEVSQSGLLLQGPRPMVSQPERAPKAMVATVHELATRAGLDILRLGGNAVDAAVAIGFVLAVVHPEAGNLGGGGYMLVRMADGRSKVIDYRETAPASARPGMFANSLEARVGYKASAVPGTPAGLEMAHKTFGSRPWAEVLEPARLLAARGFPASHRLELILALQVPVMKHFADSRRIFLHGGTRPVQQGERLVQTELAASIRRIQRLGARDFYHGETARRIAADMEVHGGTITLADLNGYQAIARDPLRGSYRGHTVLTAPPSTSGGVALLQMLNILERFPVKLGQEGSTEVRHLMIESMRRAYRDRSEFAADPKFFPVPVDTLTAKEHAAKLAATIRPDQATPSHTLSPAGNETGDDESMDTTHFTVIDAAGNLVSNTYTLNGFFGSQVVASGTGILLNDIMSGFGSRGRNLPGPGKRPVSSMTPAIVLDAESKPWFALGSPGATTIPNTVFQVIVNIIDFKMGLRDAVEYPRIHHQYLPDRVDAEPAALVTDVATALTRYGHTLNPALRSQGDVHAILVEPGTGWRLGWSDGRRGGRAAGF
ncbi:MAG: gamma-glutamyltransferase [Acidobacteria bacterium]|nr:gamma-glutamyltransferase [Acidobacteriota bacterium]